jgi:hypothetical protein
MRRSTSRASPQSCEHANPFSAARYAGPGGCVCITKAVEAQNTRCFVHSMVSTCHQPGVRQQVRRRPGICWVHRCCGSPRAGPHNSLRVSRSRCRHCVTCRSVDHTVGTATCLLSMPRWRQEMNPVQSYCQHQTKSTLWWPRQAFVSVTSTRVTGIKQIWYSSMHVFSHQVW